MIESSGYDEEGLKGIKRSLPFFDGKALAISFLLEEVYLALNNTSLFIRDKALLAGNTETTGLLLPPKTVVPDFSNGPSYINAHDEDVPLNAILYSWLESNIMIKLQEIMIKRIRG